MNLDIFLSFESFGLLRAHCTLSSSSSLYLLCRYLIHIRSIHEYFCVQCTHTLRTKITLNNNNKKIETNTRKKVIELIFITRFEIFDAFEHEQHSSFFSFTFFYTQTVLLKKSPFFIRFKTFIIVIIGIIVIITIPIYRVYISV